MGTKPPKSPAAKKVAKTAKKLPSAVRKRFKARRELEEEEDRYWSEVRRENQEKKQKRKNIGENVTDEPEEPEKEEREEHQSQQENVVQKVETVLVTIPQRGMGSIQQTKPKRVKVNRRSEKAKQRQKVNLSLN